MQQFVQSGSKQPFKQCGILLSTSMGLFILLSIPAFVFVGPQAIEGLAYASLLCLVPGLLIFLMVGFFLSDSEPVAMMAISTLVRLMFVGMGTLLVLKLRADFGLPEFLIWLLICYFASLLVETLLIIR